MTISKDLFLAILAMDSYNRGYCAGIEDEDGSGDGLGDAIGTYLGNARIVQRSDSDPNGEAVSAGFYALAYEVEASGGIDGLAVGDTVISYRGTDSVLGFNP